MKTTRRGALGALIGGAAVGPSAVKQIGRGGGAVGYVGEMNAAEPMMISPLAQKARELFYKRQRIKQLRMDAERQAVHINQPVSIREKRSWSPAFKSQKVFEGMIADDEEASFDFYSIEDTVAQKIIDALS